MGRGVHLSQRAVICARSRHGGDTKQCQSDCQDTSEMRSEEHQVGKWMRAIARPSKQGVSTIDVQMRPQAAPPANADSKEKSLRHIHSIQHTGYTLAGNLDGCTTDVQSAAPPMHDESQHSRGQTPNPYKDIWGCCQECKSRPSGMCPSGCTIWERTWVGPQRSRQTRRPPSSPELRREVCPGYAAHNPTGCTYERVRANTRPCKLTLQTTVIRSETSRWMQ